MITTSDKYKTAVSKTGRHFELKIDIAGTVYTGIKNLKIAGGTNSSDEISVGDTVSSYIEFVLTDVPKNTVLKGRKAIPYIGLKLDDGTIEWAKKGVYNLEKPIRSGEFIKLTAYDNFALCNKGFFTSLTGQQKISAILQEQCAKIGIAFAGGADNVNYDVDNLKGLTIREAIGVLAAYCGKNAIMDNEGNLKFVWYTDVNLSISPSRYADPLEVAEEDTYINRLDCTINEETSLSAGTGVGIYFSCPGMTQDRLNVLYNRLKRFTYRAGKVSWKAAQPEVEAGDIVKVIDKDGSIYTIPLMEYEFYCDGGYYGTIESKGKSVEEQENEYKGPLQTKVDRTYSELVSAKQVIADKITAFEGEFETINTNYININKKITAFEGEFDDLKSNSVTTAVLNTELAKINEAIIAKADITDLTAATGKIAVLESSVATLDTIINRVTTSDSIHSLLINASTAVIDDGYFKSIVSNLITVNDLLAGDISTTRFKVKSDSGHLVISDNTIQIRDASRPRVQIGKDANDDYSLSLWDASGALIWDARGLKAAGIKDAIIRNDMVSADANIDGSKINIDSVVTEINNGTTTINSNHILYDGKTLDVAFGTLSTSVSTVTKTITDNKSKWDLASTEASNALSKATSVETRANNGEFDGKGVASTNVTYQASTSGTTAPTGTWTATIPAVNPGQYLWTRTIITYTDNTSTTSYSVARMGANGTGTKGDKGDTGNGISSITSYYLASASSSGVTTSTEGWTTTPQSVTTSKKYHWHYQVINYTNGSSTTTTPAIIGVYGDTGAKGATGATGKGISSVVPQYYLSTSNTTQSGGLWKTTQDTWSSGKYYWTRDAITWSDSSTTYTTPVLDNGLNNANATASSALTKVTTVTETVNSHSTQITAQEGKISTLITDNTQVKQDITAVRGEVTTAKGNITTLQSNYSSLQQTVSGLNSTVGSHSSQLTTIKGTADSALSLINGLQIGGRNLVPHSEILNGYCSPVGDARFSVSYVDDADALCKKHIEFKCTAEGTGFHTSVFTKNASRIGKTYTWSFWAKCSVNKSGNVGSETGGYKSISLTTSWQYYTHTWTMQDSTYTSFTFYLGYKVNEILYIRDFKIEEGNKASSWSPAFEDIDASIATVDGRITSEIKTVTDKQSSFQQSLTAITGRVSSVESTTSSVKSTVDTNKANWDKAPTALSTANTAKSTADTAKSTADQAKTTATTASTNASTAVSTANTAKTTADSAKSAATTATNTANTAKSTADSAKSTATTANTTANSALLATKVTPLSGSAKLFKNVASYSNDNQNLKGAFVIVTPILPSKMCRFRITGYNYVSGANSDIDLTITGYNYGDSIVNCSYSNAGNVLFSSVKLAKVSATDKRLVIILGGVADTWQYPKIYVDSALISYSGVAPDSYKDGWSISLVTTLSTAYVHTVTVPGMNVQSEITTVKTKESALELTVDQFKTTVSQTYATKTQLTTVDGKFASYATTTAMNSAITAKANEITNTVSKTYATQTSLSSLTTRVTTAESKITDTAIVNTVRASSSYKSDLTAKVSKTEIVSCINQTAESIKISASKIDLSGYVTISSLTSSGSTSIDGSRIKTGYISADRIQAGSLAIGKFDSSTQGLINNSTKRIRYTIDLSSSTYNQNTYYPVVGSRIPSDGYHLFECAVQLNSGTKPTWSTHNNGFTCNLKVQNKASGWGTTDANGWIEDNSYNFCDKMPAFYNQMIYSTLPVFYLRGGGKYYIYTDYTCSWSVKTTTFTSDGQSVAPTTTPSNLSTLYSEWAIAGWCHSSNRTYINGAKIYTGTITADHIASRTLNSINLTASTITGGTITGATITGGKITSNTTIDVTTDLRVGDNITLGTNPGISKIIRFNSNTYVGRVTYEAGDHLKVYSNFRASMGGPSVNVYAAANSHTTGMYANANSGIGGSVCQGAIDINGSNGYVTFNGMRDGYISTSISYFKEGSNGRTILRPDNNGGAYLGTAGYRWNTGFFTNNITASDLKEKQVMPVYDMRTRDFIMEIKPIAYHRIGAGDTGKRIHFGFGAQTVAHTIKSLNLGNLSMVQASIINPDGTESPYHGEPIDDSRLSWGLNYNEFIPPIVSMLQLHEKDILSIKQQRIKDRQIDKQQWTREVAEMKHYYDQEIQRLKHDYDIQIEQLQSRVNQLEELLE